jgi:polyhydroxybutyrate depolymerase
MDRRRVAGLNCVARKMVLFGKAWMQPSAGWTYFSLSGLALLLAAWPVKAQLRQAPPPTTAAMAALGLKEITLTSGTRERVMLVQEPANPTAPAPVVVLLHGGSQSMRRQFGPNGGASLEWLAVARANNILLLAPNGINAETGDAKGDTQFWNDFRDAATARTTSADDVAFVRDLLTWAHKTYKTDPARTYVTGASNGGMMTYRLLVEAPETFAAGAAFIAALPVPIARVPKPARATPLMIMAGTADPLVQWNGGAIAGNRGKVVSAAENLRWWLAANGAEPVPHSTAQLPHRDNADPCRIERKIFTAKLGGAPVVFYTNQGGGHAMPSIRHKLPDGFLIRRFIGHVCRDVEAAALTWDFFKQYARVP